MVKEHSDSERENPEPPLYRLLFLISNKWFLYLPSHKTVHTTKFVTLVVEPQAEYKKSIQMTQHIMARHFQGFTSQSR